MGINKKIEKEIKNIPSSSEIHEIKSTINAYRYINKKGIKTRYVNIRENSGKVEFQKLDVINLYFVVTRTGLNKTIWDMITGIIPSIKEANCSDDKQFIEIVEMTSKVFNILIEYFETFNMFIESATIWFSKDKNNQLYLSSLVSPNTIKLWDKKTNTPFVSNGSVYNRIL